MKPAASGVIYVYNGIPDHMGRAVPKDKYLCSVVLRRFGLQNQGYTDLHFRKR